MNQKRLQRMADDLAEICEHANNQHHRHGVVCVVESVFVTLDRMRLEILDSMDEDGPDAGAGGE